MKMRNYEKKHIILGMAIVMTLLPSMFVTDALGIGPDCTPCEHLDFLYCNGTWACFGCPGFCGACYTCNPAGPSCEPTCKSEECKECNVVDDPGGCPDWHCAGCKSVCNSSNCEECVGGLCLPCGGRQYEECCNGSCIDTREQQCCGDTSTAYPCDINSSCCNGSCCDPPNMCCNGECKLCPDERASGNGALCEIAYGGYMNYCYSCAQNWWCKENVTPGPHSCELAEPVQNTNPSIIPTGCMPDNILNDNGPPENVGPCFDMDFQVFYLGPTRETVEQCAYDHMILIYVSSGSSPGTVTTTAGATVSCTY